MMFRLFSVVAFILSFVWVFKYLKQNGISLNSVYNFYIVELKKSFTDLKAFKSKTFSEKLVSLKGFLYLFTLLEFFIMVFTGFVTLIFTGGDITGILLLIHVTVAPFIAITFALVVVFYAQSNSFNENDVEMQEKSILKNSAHLKINFWLINLFALPAMVSIILSMFPFFGTEGQMTLLEIHRYSVLIISILVIFRIGLLSVNSKGLIKN